MEIGRALTNLGQVITDRGAAVEATPYLEEGLKIRRKQFPNGESQILAVSISALAQCWQNQGMLDKAGELWQEVMPIREKLLGPENVFVTGDLLNFGEWNRRKGDLKKAFALGLKSLRIREKLQPTDDSLLIQNYSLLGRIEEDQGNLAQAEEWFRKALVLLTKLHGAANTRTTADSMLDVGQALIKQGSKQEGAQLLKNALHLRRAQLPTEDPQRVTAERIVLAMLQ